MNNHQTARLALKSTASALSDVVEMYLSQKMNEVFFDPALGAYDVVIQRHLPPTQHGISAFFRMGELIFYPTNIADFAWMNKFIYQDVAISISELWSANYVPPSTNATQMKQWQLVKNAMLHAEIMLIEHRVVDKLHELVLETQRSFGEFQQYEPGEIGNYPPEMNTAEVVELTMMALIKRLPALV